MSPISKWVLFLSLFTILLSGCGREDGSDLEHNSIRGILINVDSCDYNPDVCIDDSDIDY